MKRSGWESERLTGAGMATHLSPEDQGLMLELFQAFSRLDGREIGECTLKFSKDNQVRLCCSPYVAKVHVLQVQRCMGAIVCRMRCEQASGLHLH